MVEMQRLSVLSERDRQMDLSLSPTYCRSRPTRDFANEEPYRATTHQTVSGVSQWQQSTT
ncbi:hypothetical protein NIES2104_32050 [Leptolyngbya sp. NIES-2104]|nr:hypothetical protein NIES2104_32050 [Leptolyngbya sp. NIES-2104]